jgi:aspartate racemase
MATAPVRADAHGVIGIIGGMGPEATVELMRRVIARTPANDDEDHIHLIVESNPKIPSRIAHLIEQSGEDPTPELVRIARNLERAGADALAMPCNTAHSYAAAIQAAVSVPLLDMVRLTVEQIAVSRPAARVGVLASTAVHRAGVYSRGFDDRGLIPKLPRRQEELMTLIRGVKRGDTSARAAQQLAAIGRELRDHCDITLIACSELSLISAVLAAAGPTVDSLDVLTQAIVDFAAARTR